MIVDRALQEIDETPHGDERGQPFAGEFQSARQQIRGRAGQENPEERLPESVRPEWKIKEEGNGL